MKNKQLVYELQVPPRIVVKKGGTTVFLQHNEVDWIEADGLYTIFHSNVEKYSVRENIGQVEHKLDANLFMRIHRSVIVNINRIRQIRSWFRGEYKVVLMNGTELTCSRNFKHKISQFIQNPGEVQEKIRGGHDASSTPEFAGKSG